MLPAPVILLCRCSAADVVTPERTEAVARGLAEHGVGFECVDDLCGVAARRDPSLARIAFSQGAIRIAACYPRAVKWLFAAAGAPLPAGRAEFFNLRLEAPPEVVAHLLRPNSGAGSAERGDRVLPGSEEDAPPSVREGTPGARELAPNWRSWFPVIDFDRCTHCMQCLSFCLFGVYGVDPQRRITVAQPENCKTNCPACSRVCPEAAIVFPKFGSGPINGGEVSSAGIERQAMKVDISALLGGDVYATLRNREGAARFSEERDPETALRERRRCLAVLARLGDIPPEVLMTLPSPEEIHRRADEAKARADAALSSGK